MSFSTLNTAVTALHAHRRAMDVVGNNIANAQTEGYSRRRVDLKSSGASVVPALFSRTNGAGGGVEVSRVLRIRDELLAARVHREYGVQGRVGVEATTFRRIEDLLPEPSDNGLGEQMARFWSAWDDAANTPNNPAVRTALLERAEALTGSFRQVADRLENLRDGARDAAAASVAEVNDLASRVAELNNRIIQATGGGTDPSDLADERDRLVTRLSKIVDVTTRAADDGGLDVFVGGSTLVRGDRSFELEAVEAGPLPTPLDATGLQRVVVRWRADGSEPRINQGSLAGQLASANEIIPGVISGLDTVAESLVTRINAIHSTGQNLADPPATGLNFLDPAATRARTLRLDAAVSGQPFNIALGAVGEGGLDGSIGRQIARIAMATDGPDATYRSLIASIGVDSRSTILARELQESVVRSVEDDLDSVVGVNLDEELAQLVQHQRAYEAAARVLTTVDQALDQLINRTGVVGR